MPFPGRETLIAHLLVHWPGQVSYLLCASVSSHLWVQFLARSIHYIWTISSSIYISSQSAFRVCYSFLVFILSILNLPRYFLRSEIRPSAYSWVYLPVEMCLGSLFWFYSSGHLWAPWWLVHLIISLDNDQPGMSPVIFSEQLLWDLCILRELWLSVFWGKGILALTCINISWTACCLIISNFGYKK